MYNYKNERRMFDRFEVDFSAEFRESGGTASRFAQCCDVSAAGAGLISHEMLAPETKLELWLGIPDGHPPFHGAARVVWTKKFLRGKWRAGLEFDAADFMGIRRIFDSVGSRT